MPTLGVAMAAGRQVRMLTSVADRDRAIRILQASFVEGRLAMDEFEQRVGLAIVSRDFRELLALTADLPTGPFDRLPAHRVTPRPSDRRQSRGWFTRIAQGSLRASGAIARIKPGPESPAAGETEDGRQAEARGVARGPDQPDLSAESDDPTSSKMRHSGGSGAVWSSS